MVLLGTLEEEGSLYEFWWGGLELLFRSKICANSKSILFTVLTTFCGNSGHFSSEMSCCCAFCHALIFSYHDYLKWKINDSESESVSERNLFTFLSFRTQFYDASESRFEVPIPLLPRPAEAARITDYTITYTTRPFTLEITRKSTGEVL